MSRALPELSPLPDREVAGLRKALAGPLNLRRDLYRFVCFVRREGLRRTYRDNGIPKGPASKLAKLLSWPEEAACVAEKGRGLWSDKVSMLAHKLGLVSFDVKGEYAGYSSSEPCFPDNDVEVQEKKLAAWLKDTPWEKEQAILTALVEETPSELYHEATLLGGRRFDCRGCAVGPASRMNLPAIRRRLLELLAELPAATWLPMGGFIDLVRARAPTLILDPKLRQPLSKWERERQGGRVIEDLYSNFREATVRDPWSHSRQLSEKTKDVFRRVEGRYLQYFLQEIPYLCGFVDLAFDDTPAKPDDPVPPLQPLAAFCLSPRLAQLARRDPELSRVRVAVMPNFEVLVEAPSFPDRELDALGPFCSVLKEDGPTHLLRVERKAVVEHVASATQEPPKIRELLETLSGRPLPPNVAAEIESWCGHAEKLTVYEGVGLVELRGPAELQASVRSELGALLLDDDGPEGFLLARDPERTLSVLEQRLRAPIAVTHSKAAFAACEGPLGARREEEPQPPRAAASAPAPRRVRLRAEDLVGYRSEDAALLAALYSSLQRAGKSGCRLMEGEGLLLVPAGELAEVRAALKRLGDQFDVDLGR